MATAPDDASLQEIASAAWVAYEQRADPADVWDVVLADSRECWTCGLPHLRAAGNSTLTCLNCGSAFQVGGVP